MCVTLNGNARGKSELSPVLLVPEKGFRYLFNIDSKHFHKVIVA